MTAVLWNGAVLGIGALLVAATVVPRLPLDHWIVPAACFPRVHVAVLAAGVLVAGVAGWQHLGTAARIALAPVAGAVVYQLVWIAPYTRCFPVQVRDAWTDGGPRLSVLIANVLMENRRTDGLVELARRLDPDVVVTLEPDAAWARALSALDGRWPHAVAEPRDNTYGMTLHSKLELLERRVDHLVLDDVPSIAVVLRLPDGRTVDLRAVHPRPPVPDEAEEPSERDAELLIVAREADESSGPRVVVGDLNAVAWSPSTKLFQRVSGLLDPRVGRGAFGTFHAGWPPPRFPLDHVFHSDVFTLELLETHPIPGSDHRAVLVRLVLEPRAAPEQEAPDEEPGDRAEAAETIRAGRAAAADEGG